MTLRVGVLLAVCCVAVAGCDLIRPPTAAPLPKTTKPVMTAPAPVGVAPPVVPGQPPFGAAGGSAAVKPVRLSAATALPQTGPEGEIVGFTADYSVSGELPAGAKTVWVITRDKGTPAEVPVELQAQGSLPAHFQPWRSDDGPFESWIEARTADGQRQEISDRVSMR